jgi:SMI1 / KNR4 family (SUKH-1)
MLHTILEAGKPVLPKHVQRFEQEAGVSLPPSLRRQLQMVNGGVPQPCWVRCAKSAFIPDGLCYVDRLLGLPVPSSAGSGPVIRAEPTPKRRGVTHYILFATSGDSGIWLETNGGSEGPVYCQMDISASLATALRDGQLAKIHDSFESFWASFEYHPKSLPWLPYLHKHDYRLLSEWIKSTKNINCKDEFDMTPLEVAASLGDQVAVQFLLSAKAKVAKAAEVASQFGHHGLATMLKRASK